MPRKNMRGMLMFIMAFHAPFPSYSHLCFPVQARVVDNSVGTVDNSAYSWPVYANAYTMQPTRPHPSFRTANYIFSFIFVIKSRFVTAGLQDSYFNSLNHMVL